MTYQELEEQYNRICESKRDCPHPRAEVTEDSGVVTVNCIDCGLHGIMSRDAAIYLKWINV